MSKREALSGIRQTGVGWKDYTQDTEFATEAFIRTVQERFFYSVFFSNLAALTFPNVYETRLDFLVDSVLTRTAPKRPYMFYLLSASTDSNALVYVSLLRYANYQDFLNGVVAEYLGTAFGYGKAEVELTKGLRTNEGSVYSVQFGEFCGRNFNMNLVLHGLIGGVEEIE